MKMNSWRLAEITSRRCLKEGMPRFCEVQRIGPGPEHEVIANGYRTTWIVGREQFKFRRKVSPPPKPSELLPGTSVLVDVDGCCQSTPGFVTDIHTTTTVTVECRHCAKLINVDVGELSNDVQSGRSQVKAMVKALMFPDRPML